MRAGKPSCGSLKVEGTKDNEIRKPRAALTSFEQHLDSLEDSIKESIYQSGRTSCEL